MRIFLTKLNQTNLNQMKKTQSLFNLTKPNQTFVFFSVHGPHTNIKNFQVNKTISNIIKQNLTKSKLDQSKIFNKIQSY